jgi:hypothetical protein
MKIYVIAYHGDDYSCFGPVLATRELAEKTLALRDEEDEMIEKYEVLTQVPSRVTRYYAQRIYNHQQQNYEILTGSHAWWDYDVNDLPQNEWISWAETEAEALAALQPLPA